VPADSTSIYVRHSYAYIFQPEYPEDMKSKYTDTQVMMVLMIRNITPYTIESEFYERYVYFFENFKIDFLPTVTNIKNTVLIQIGW